MINNNRANIWLQHKYANLVSPQLIRFSKKGKGYLHRCHVCGDSKKDKFKRRAYLYEGDGSLWWVCFNCSLNKNFDSFLRELSEPLYREYKLECLMCDPDYKEPTEQKPSVEIKNEKPKFASLGPLKQLKKISQLAHNHPAKLYVESRLIPSRTHYKLYYCPAFMKWVNTIIPDKFDRSALRFDEPRLILPFIDQEKVLFGFQGRSFNPKSNLRYISIMIDEEKPKVFGLDTIDFDQRIHIVEGPIDSLFIPNCLAFAGSDGNYNQLLSGRDKVYIYDNEPRNVEICKKIKNKIDEGESVVIWPSEADSFKDINDLVKASRDPFQMIETNTYRAHMALLKFNEWKRCHV